MWQSRIAVVMAVALFSPSVAYAQLGPKDVAKLSPTDPERVKVGDHAPDFTLENVDRKRISLSDFRGKKKEDKDHKVIDRYGIFNPDGKGWPHPATYVIDKQGVVRWKYVEVDYTKRPTNEEILQALRAIR